jgi:hypothetical protein
LLADRRICGQHLKRRGLRMAGVFLSYDRDDSARARPLALALEKAGHAVWWDLHVRGGAQFSKVIEEALKAADAVVVLWSKDSVESPWVRDEAAAGRDSGRLVPVSLDRTEPPLGFRQFQTIDLSKWTGRGKPAELQTLLASIAALEPERNRMPVAEPPGRVSSGTRDNRQLPLFAAIALLALVGAGLAWWRPWNASGPSVVAVRPADQGAGSQHLAQDLLVQLGTLRPALASSMKLVSSTANIGRPDLVFQTAVIPGGTGESLVLSDANEEVLWSKQFQDPNSNAAEQRQQVGFTAARVLRCALQESSGKHGRLQSDLRQMFLDACAASTEIGWDMRSLVLPLRKVTEAAPKFRPAWAQLLMAEVNAASFMRDSTGDEQWRSALQSDTNRARKYFPDMAEITVAEYEAGRNLSFSEAVGLLDKAKSQDPDNPFVLSQHALAMVSTGRVIESVDDERRAAALDPLSPGVRAEYIRALAYAGKIDLARAELARAKQLWPGTETLREAETSIELRYGDFEKVLRESEEYSGPAVNLYIAARKDPTDSNVAAVLGYLNNNRTNSGLAAMGVQALGEMNRVDEVFRFLDAAPPDVLKGVTYVLFRPWLANARRDPRFMALAKRIGLLEYWQKSGHWPDFCSDPGLKYDCKAEAAKLG